MKRVRPIKDKQTVTPSGERTAPRIEGLEIRHAKTQLDRRGELCEIYNPAWELHPAPLVYAYQATVRPGEIKGWVMHKIQTDRIFVSLGVQRWIFFDDRRKSKTYKMINSFTFGERQRALLIIPTGIFHAVQNVGATEAMFLNLPTHPYNHADPDKYRLPVKNDLIPFNFDDDMSW